MVKEYDEADFGGCNNPECLNNRNSLGRTALLQTICAKKFEWAKNLILAGADVNIPDFKHATPLHWAVCDPNLVLLLINYGANIDSRDTNDQTPLHYAVAHGLLETVYILLYYNADTTITNERNYTAFMMAIERKDIEMQEALFEYIDDYNVITTTERELSLLGLALRYDSPYAEEIVIRGANVNNTIDRVNGSLDLLLQCSSHNVNAFRLIWERMHYKPTETISVLGTVCQLERSKATEFHKIIDIFIGSKKLRVIAESVAAANDFSAFMVKCIIDYSLPYNKVEALFSILLCHGYNPNDTDLMIIYSFWGYCDIFKNSLCMNIRIRDWEYRSVNEIATKLLYDVKYSSKELLDKLIAIIEGGNDYGQEAVMIRFALFRILDYFLYPPLNRVYTRIQKSDCVTLKIEALPKVPSLLELARNQSREHFRKARNVTDSCRLYTLINSLDIGSPIKKILTFETVTYRPTFTRERFHIYIKMLDMAHLPDRARERFVHHILKYSNIVD